MLTHAALLTHPSLDVNKVQDAAAFIKKIVIKKVDAEDEKAASTSLVTVEFPCTATSWYRRKSVVMGEL